MKRWLIFIKERFEPLSHLILISSLFLANLLIAWDISTEASREFDFSWDYPAAFAVIFLMFFHLRLFDEIKDYTTDLKINPHRPLPRGLIHMREFKNITFSVIWVELMICANLLSSAAFISALVMVGYSFLMYNEFFIGKWLGPRMELYAISHTVVSGFMALFICSVVSGLPVWSLKLPHLLIALINWMVFNIFEFARKTFGKDEENPLVESYSKRLTPAGAVLAVILNALLALVFLMQLYPFLTSGDRIIIRTAIIVSLCLAATGLSYAAINRTLFAKLYRGTATFYLFFFNAQIAWFLL